MSTRNSLKRLLGIGAFVCCSVVLLGVTAHSARSEQLPTVSELGTIVTDPLGFVREQPVPPAVPAASAELDLPAEPDGSDAAGAETEEAADPVPAGEETFVFLPDFTDPSDEEETENETRDSAVPAAVIDDGAGGVSDTLSLTSAELQSASVSGGKEDPKDPPEETVPEDKEKTSGEEKNEPSGSAEAEGPAAGTEEPEKSEGPEKEPEAESAASSDEKYADGETEAPSEPAAETEDAGAAETAEAAETDSGEEELVAVAAVTLSLKTDNKHHQEYLHGYDDGTARPGGKITRAEACQILYNLLERKPDNRLGLKDVSDDAWYAEPVRLLAAYSIIDCPDGKARPTDYMTRAELVSALYRLVSAGSASTSASGKSDFSDMPASHPYAGAIAAAVKLGWVNGYEDGTAP